VSQLGGYRIGGMDGVGEGSKPTITEDWQGTGEGVGDPRGNVQSGGICKGVCMDVGEKSGGGKIQPPNTVGHWVG